MHTTVEHKGMNLILGWFLGGKGMLYVNE